MTTFAPKITHRIAGMHINTGDAKPMSPWQYLQHWNLADKGLEQSSREWINQEMQSHWPGPYRVERCQSRYAGTGWRIDYEIRFQDPAEETLFRLRWA